MATYSMQQIERRVRSLTRDNRHGAYVCDPDILFFAVDRAISAVFQKLIQPPTFVAALVTLAQGTYSYALGAGYKDLDVTTGFRLASTGQPVVKRDLVTWQDYRRGNPSQTGDPVVIAFGQDVAGAETAYVWPTPTTADTLSGLVSTGYGNNDQSFRQNGASLYDSSGFSLDLPGQTMRVVEYRAASELIAGFDTERLTALNLNGAVAKLYMDISNDVLDQELKREHRLRRSGAVLVRNPY